MVSKNYKSNLALKNSIAAFLDKFPEHKRIREHNLPESAFKWYLECRQFGTVPHSGFGMGIERTVTWLSGIHHLRESIPYPRTIGRLYP